MNRAQRHIDLERFARDVGRELVTYLVEPDDPRLRDMPLLMRASQWWIAALSTRMRHCFSCGSWLPDRRYVGLLLLSTPAVADPATASVSGLCRKCANLPAEKIERAAAAALSTAVPGGRFE
jgi:hypothetical protein